MSRPTSEGVTPSTLPVATLDFLHDTTLDDFPAEVIDFGRRCLLDLLGVAAAGRTTRLSGIIHNHAAHQFGPGSKQASLWFDGRMVSPAGAALANGMTIDSIDAHDGNKFTKGHSGCHQLPALLAFTEAEQRIDAADFLTSLIVGYEIATRAGIALHATAADYHTSGAWGAVACAGLGARILKLDHLKSFHAMGIAEYHGPRSQMMRVIDHPSMLKDGSGWGAMARVSAAYLAADGFTGAPAVTICDPSVDAIWADLGGRWIILEQYFKPHPVCRWAQPAVEAALALCAQHRIDAANVATIHVSTFHEAARLAGAHPQSTEEAQYALSFPVAAAVLRGQLGPSEVNAAGLAASDVHALADRISIDENASHNAAFPGNRFAQVRIAMNDGREFVSTDTEPRGDPEAHLSDEEIRSKFGAYSTLTMSADDSNDLAKLVECWPQSDSVTRLLELIGR